jgi:hypothetical protein
MFKQPTIRFEPLTSKLLRLLGGVLLALLLFEVGLRVAGIRFDASLFTGHRIRGFALRPYAEGWKVSEGEAYVRINSDGLSDREHTLKKPPNTLRIAVLGDSYTEARQVEADRRFTAIMERHLSRCPALQGHNVEVINFGIGGYGTAQELLTLRHHVWKYEPDVVVLQFYTGNDVFDNHSAFPQEGPRPYFVHKGGELVLDDSFRNSPRLSESYIRLRGMLADIMNRSRVLLLLNEADIRFRRLPSQQGGGLGFPPDFAAWMPYVPPVQPAMVEAWRVTEDLLRLMRDEVHSRRADFYILNATMPMQVHPDESARREFRERLGLDTLYYPDTRLEAFAHRANIPIISMYRPLGDYAVKHKVFVHGFPNTPPGYGHYNELGHRLVGEAAASWLCDLLVRPSGRFPRSSSRQSSVPTPLFTSQRPMARASG